MGRDTVEVLRRHAPSQTVLDEWLDHLRQGRLPFDGRWRAREEIENLRDRLRRRSWLTLTEVFIVVLLVAALDVLLFLVLSGI